MPHTVRSRLYGCKVRRAQLDEIVRCLDDAFPGRSAARTFVVVRGSAEYARATLGSALDAAGGPAVGRGLRISVEDRDRDRSAQVEVSAACVRVAVTGEGGFPDGLRGQVLRVLEESQGRGPRFLVTPGAVRALLYLLVLEVTAGVTAAFAPGAGPGAGTVLAGTAALAVCTALARLLLQRRTACAVFFTAGAGGPWSRADRINLGVLSTAVAGLVLTGVALLGGGGGSGADEPAEPAASSGSGAPSGSAAPPGSGAAAVEVVSSTTTGEDMSWAFADARDFSDAQLAGVSELDDYEEYREWFESRGGVSLGAKHHHITLEGRSDRTVKIIGMTAVRDCRAPLTGTLFYAPNQGVNDTTRLRFDLDDPFPAAEEVGPGTASPDYFTKHKITLAPGEQIDLEVEAAAGERYCAYEFRLVLLVGGRRVVQSIDDGGKPFRVTPLPAAGAWPEYLTAYRRLFLSGGLSPCGSGVFAAVDPGELSRYSAQARPC